MLINVRQIGAIAKKNVARNMLSYDAKIDLFHDLTFIQSLLL